MAAAVPSPIVSPSSSFQVFGGQYNDAKSPFEPLYASNQFTNRVKNHVSEWQSWRQESTGNIGQYHTGSLKIRDNNFSTFNGRNSGGWATDGILADRRQYKNGFMGNLNVVSTGLNPKSPNQGANVVLAAADFTAISESAVPRIDVDSWFVDIGGMFTLGDQAFSSGYAVDTVFHNGYRGRNSYGGGGSNANTNYAVYFIQNQFKGLTNKTNNGRIVMYQVEANKFTEAVRNISLPISKSLIDMITTSMDATGSVSILTYGGLPVLQPKEIYGQQAMFLPSNGTNFSIESINQPV